MLFRSDCDACCVPRYVVQEGTPPRRLCRCGYNGCWQPSEVDPLWGSKCYDCLRRGWNGGCACTCSSCRARNARFLLEVSQPLAPGGSRNNRENGEEITPNEAAKIARSRRERGQEAAEAFFDTVLPFLVERGFPPDMVFPSDEESSDEPTSLPATAASAAAAAEGEAKAYPGHPSRHPPPIEDQIGRAHV